VEERPPIWRVAANILNKQSPTVGERRVVYRVLVGKPEGKRPLGDPGVDGRIILSWIFRKLDVGVWSGSSWLRIGTVGGHFGMW